MSKTSRFDTFIWQYAPLISLFVAIDAMVGSLYFSEVRKYIPCNLCWYQRILMYPLVAILLVGVIKRDRNLPYYVLPLSFLGILVSSYHYALEWGIFPPVACNVGVPCSTPYFWWFNFITIAFLALIAFLLISFFMLNYWRVLRQYETT